LLPAGVDLRTGRLGHAGGGATTLEVYAVWVGGAVAERLRSLVSESPAGYPVSCQPSCPRRFDLACKHGTTITGLARELAWSLSHLRRMLGGEEYRPALRLLTN
jgi:hypothetical protein